MRAGELLIEAKAALTHGAFGPWLAANVAFSVRTARGYMALARMDEGKRRRVAVLSFTRRLDGSDTDRGADIVAVAMTEAVPYAVPAMTPKPRCRASVRHNRLQLGRGEGVKFPLTAKSGCTIAIQRMTFARPSSAQSKGVATMFKPGQSGNPAGRKKGVPDRRTQARELFMQQKDALIGKAIELALTGDATALRLCLDRIVPSLKPAATTVTLPGLPPALAGKGELVLTQLAAGAITPDEAATIMGAIAAQVRIVEVSQLEERVRVLEETNNAKP